MTGGPLGKRKPSALAARAARELAGQLDQLTYRTGLRSTAGLRLPEFLGIGAQKAGSTWLHANLARHPEVFVPDEKELHYFDWFLRTSMRSYAEVFAGAGARVAGEISPGYSAMSSRRVRAAKALIPDAKILLLLRDPIERAWSQVLMAARRAGRDAASISVVELLAYTRAPGARRRSEYARIIAEWGAIFGPGHLWVGFHDDIVHRPEHLLAEVFTHLGVSVPIDWSGYALSERYNPGSGAAPAPEQRAALEKELKAELDALELIHPDQVARWRSA